MPTVSDRFDRRLVGLVAVLVGAAVLQVVAVAGTGDDDDVQLVVIGTASIVMFLALGALAWLIRGGTE